MRCTADPGPSFFFLKPGSRVCGAPRRVAARCAAPGTRASMLAPNTDPTVASIFAPRTTIEPDGTVEGYASLFGAVGQARELLALLRAGAIDGLSIGFRTTKGRIDPRTRVRSLVAVDLWEISIVTFPLLAGARVRAVKHSPSRSQSGFALAEHGAAASPGRPRASLARARAERDWGTVAGGCGAADVPAPRPLIRGGVAVSAKQARRRPDGKRWPGRIRTWRQAEQI